MKMSGKYANQHGKRIAYYVADKSEVIDLKDFHNHICIGVPIYKYVDVEIDGTISKMVYCKTCDKLFRLNNVNDGNQNKVATVHSISNTKQPNKKSNQNTYRKPEIDSKTAKKIEKRAERRRQKLYTPNSISGKTAASKRLAIEAKRAELKEKLDQMEREHEEKLRREELERIRKIHERNRNKLQNDDSESLSENRQTEVLIVNERSTDLMDKANGLPRIRVQDFVVKGNSFRCENANHEVVDIEAVVDVLNKRTLATNTFILPAGYCKTCNTFFILDSVFEHLKTQGIILCRIEDEKDYHNTNAKFNLAAESILMQYGYSVSKARNLSRSARQSILAIMIDSSILTKSGIISYLDFFIRQRKSQKMYADAIEKWEEDREFVQQYHKGSFEKYGLRSLTRK